jgi:hypothetical protein
MDRVSTHALARCREVSMSMSMEKFGFNVSESAVIE